MRTWSKRELLSYLDRVEPVLATLDHFELLDVDAEASGDAIRRAFHAVASGLHPDRHRHALSDTDRERLTVVYARIAEAYRVLRDPGERERYLRDAAREPRATPAAAAGEAAQVSLLSPKAQRLYRRARAALRTGDRGSAVLNLRMALATHPNSTFLRDALRAAQRD